MQRYKDNKLTKDKYWSKSFEGTEAYLITGIAQDYILEGILPKSPDLKAIEIGAYPGAIITGMAKKYGYKPTALDYVEETTQINDFYDLNGISGEVVKADFFDYAKLRENKEKFDIVSSFGFIEHFTNYEEVIKLHLELLKPGGYLVITVPNLGLVQLGLRRLLYNQQKLDEILDIHNLEAMDLRNLLHALTKYEDENSELEIKFANYTRNMSIWFTMDPKTTRPDREWIYKLAKTGEKLAKTFNLNGKALSPEILIVAQKLES